ncbi:MAG: hypothetical protein GWN79_26050, partial [Actinobacteria bacterium]|nr:hypothetical protein [Actinomycetota bacterium]NIS36349.1 hypothetical protein [Actinomycetota bacterium]NIU22298.1 hypothetical protein [Actinomycetota bacterium]NIU70878.1 hypothetical protein [Actinomycetota bacterium]NIW32803.1 hypothetical protein [Actinomycetota bacterium]
VWLDGESRPYLVDFDLSAVAASAGSTGGRKAAQRDDLRAFAALASSLLGVPVQDASSGHGIVAEARATLGRTTTATAVEVIRSPYKGL